MFAFLLCLALSSSLFFQVGGDTLHLLHPGHHHAPRDHRKDDTSHHYEKEDNNTSDDTENNVAGRNDRDSNGGSL
jgi:hypothetical protein